MSLLNKWFGQVKNGIWYKDHTFGIFLNRSGKKELQEKIEINREKSDVKNNR